MQEQKKEKIKLWLKNNYNLLFLGILIFGILIRLYYFFITKNQPLWWDEAEYMSIAKNFAFDTSFRIGAGRTVLFPFLASLVYRIGFSEVAIRFFLVLIPSILILFVTYYFVKEMYNEKIALLTTLITSVCWIHLFYSMRLMTDELSFLFGLTAWFCFWKGYVSGKNNKLVYLSAFFIGLSFMTRPTGILYPVALILFLFITEQFKFLKKPQLWLMLVVFFLTISPHMIWSYSQHGDVFAFRQGYGGPDTSQGSLWGTTKLMLSFIYSYPELIFFIFFIIGLFSLFFLLLNIDRVLKNKFKQNDLFMLLTIIFTEFFFIYFLRAAENRWLMMMSFAIFGFSAKGILMIYNYTKKNFGKMIPLIFLILVLVLGSYYQLNHTNAIIHDRLTSYEQVKESGLWLNEKTDEGDIIFSRSWSQHSYYSEREVLFFEGNQSLIEQIKEKQPKYYVVSVFEPHADEEIQLPAQNPSAFSAVQIYSIENQPALIIYKIDSSVF